MKRPKKQRLLLVLIFAGALAAGAAVFLIFSGTPAQNRYQLSDERLFGITNLDEVVGRLRDSLKNRSKEINISFSLQNDYMDDISPFVRELMEFAMEETGEPDEGDYIRYQLGGYTFSYGHEAVRGGYRYSVSIQPVYYSTQNQERQTAEKVKEILAELSLPENAGDFEKILTVHDYLAENVSYDVVHKNNDYHTLKSTAYGALVLHSATCQGYAVSFYRLLSELGVKCRVIMGEGMDEEGAEDHAWNIVEIGGLYYNVDVTWDDRLDCKDYFLKASDSFEKHRRDDVFLTEDFNSRHPMAKEDYSPGIGD